MGPQSYNNNNKEQQRTTKNNNNKELIFPSGLGMRSLKYRTSNFTLFPASPCRSTRTLFISLSVCLLIPFLFWYILSWSTTPCWSGGHWTCWCWERWITVGRKLDSTIMGSSEVMSEIFVVHESKFHLGFYNAYDQKKTVGLNACYGIWLNHVWSCIGGYTHFSFKTCLNIQI